MEKARIPRGTAPTITVGLDIEANTLEALFLTIVQQKMIVLEKSLDDGIPVGTDVVFELSQADTLKLYSDTETEVQVRGRPVGGLPFVSEIFNIDVGRILKEGEV